MWPDRKIATLSQRQRLRIIEVSSSKCTAAALNEADHSEVQNKHYRPGKTEVTMPHNPSQNKKYASREEA
jgi:hypothetical protein